jgi:hypothetical protein
VECPTAVLRVLLKSPVATSLTHHVPTAAMMGNQACKQWKNKPSQQHKQIAARRTHFPTPGRRQLPLDARRDLLFLV